MSSIKTTLIAAVFLAAALTGLVLAAEESDAESVTVTYSLDGASIPVQTAEDGTLVLYDAEDVKAFYTPDDPTKEFAGWKTADNIIYQFGATVVFDKATTLTPYLKDIPQTVGFIAGDETVTASISDGSVTVPEIVIDREGFTFDGWQWSEDGEVYSAEEIADLTVKAGQTFTAVYSEIFEVSWVVDGITIATGDTTDTKMPADPAKDNYDFKGWRDSEGILLNDEYVYTKDTVFTAVFEPVMLTVTFVAGEQTVATVSVPYGQTVVMPALPEGFKAWDFDFATPITESRTIEAIEADPEPDNPDTGVYTVQFVVDGQVIATYASNAVTVPNDPVKEGSAFQGWAIGDNVIADPATYTYTSDTVLTALFKDVEVVMHTVVFYVNGDTHYTVQVVDGEAVTAPEAPEGMQWDPAIDLKAPVTADMTVDAVPLKVTVQFAVDGKVVAILTQVIDYGGTVDAALLASYTFPAGYDGWDADLTMPVYQDTTIDAKPIVVPEPTHWYDDQVKLLVVILAVLAIAAALGYIIYLRSIDALPKRLAKLAKKTKTDITTGGKSE